MKRYKQIISIASVLFMSACQSKPAFLNQTIEHETKFGGVYIHVTIEDFSKKGFSYGDSVDIKYSNGFELLDLPYYNGYYVDNLAPLLVGYRGYPYIKTCLNNGPDMWENANMKDTDTVDIRLNKKGKYLDVQEALDIHYSDEQGDQSDEVFGNFRASNISTMKEGILYRSASPIDNQHKRAAVVDKLITNKVKTVMNLSDDDEEIVEHINGDDFNSPYYKSLCDSDNVIALAMNMNFQTSLDQSETIDVPSLFTEFKSETFAQKLVKGLNFIAEREAPYLVHCVEGKDRTGFVCMVLEALSGASYDEMIDDYMITYDNYYGITKEKEPSKYNVLKEKNIDVMLKTVIGDDTVDIKTADYKVYTERYLLSKGMKQETINKLRNVISK